ncbi:YdcF family protein [Atrimonas thermophila]|uniref:YdcF family protein n=1 Tax=Atrimonas thermophila TaxID=3064161 RepID=UPI00399C98C8
MGFYFQKALGAMLDVPGILITVILVLLFFTWKKKNSCRHFLLFLAIFTYLLSSGWVAKILEPEYLETRKPPSPPQAIVVLGGGSLRGNNAHLPGPYSMLRLNKAFTLWKEGKPLLILSGGSPWGEKVPSEARAMQAVLRAWGVPEEKMLLEEHSRTTWENAREVAQKVRELGIKSLYLVTSGVHLKRALLAFRHFLPEVSIYPVSAHPAYDRYPLSLEDFLPSLKAFVAIAQIFHEELGYLPYWLRLRF